MSLSDKKKCILCTYFEFINCAPLNFHFHFLLFLLKFHQDLVSSNYFQGATGEMRDMLVLSVGLLQE
jgi:hypothetical protein